MTLYDCHGITDNSVYIYMHGYCMIIYEYLDI